MSLKAAEGLFPIGQPPGSLQRSLLCLLLDSCWAADCVIDSVNQATAFGTGADAQAGETAPDCGVCVCGEMPAVPAQIGC